MIKKLLYDEKTINNEHETFSALSTLIIMEEYEFLYEFFNSSFSKKHDLKERHKSLWYLFAYSWKEKMPNEYLKMGPELKKTFNEQVKMIDNFRQLIKE